ncbi:hypothetical protein [Halospeciosus flavus]|uniref:Uncharacterized protein n=1 Tax=Halospeciosus flavus TaxID=3032283 RepID=A0ABD5YXE6_9EURY|nr:hypothetical protein [Halospeciosus flavus]
MTVSLNKMADKDSAPLVQIDELTKIASIDLENVDNVSPSLRDDLLAFLLALDDEDYASAAELCGRVSEDLKRSRGVNNLVTRRRGVQPCQVGLSVAAVCRDQYGIG